MGDGKALIAPRGLNLEGVERFFELSHDLLAVFDAGGHFRLFNPAWTRLLGWSPEELQALGPRALIHSDDVARSFDLDAPSGTLVSFENRYRSKTGEFKWLLWSATAADGEIYAIARDVTVERRLGEERVHAQRMEAFGRIAGSVSHDFNNMLSAILGFAHIVCEELPERDPLRADVLEIIRAADRATQLTRQLLAFSRRQVLEPRRTDVNSVIRESEKMLRRIVGEDVEFALHLGDVGTILIDPAQLEQVLLNLVVNARDAVEEGGRIVIETSDAGSAGIAPGATWSRAPNDAAYVRLSVRDDGVGIPAENHHRIFEPFFTTKELGHGTGLGLATVFGIVGQSNGCIALDSELGRGTTFHLLFPEVAGPPSVVRRLSTLMPNGPVHNGTILVVDDDAAVRDIVARILRRAGHTVLVATHPGEALLVVEQHEGRIDILVTDVVMPRLDGPKLAARVRLARPEIGILFMSGNNAAIESATAGDTFLAKPLSRQELLACVQVLLVRNLPP